MIILIIVGFVGSFLVFLCICLLVEFVIEFVIEWFDVIGYVFDLGEFGFLLGNVCSLGDLDVQVCDLVYLLIYVDVLVIVSLMYKGSYVGLFKYVFDLLDFSMLQGKLILLVVIGGGDCYVLMIEYQFCLFFVFFEVQMLGMGIYVLDREFVGGKLVDEVVWVCLSCVVNQFVFFFLFCVV